MICQFANLESTNAALRTQWNADEHGTSLQISDLDDAKKIKVPGVENNPHL